MSEMEEKVAISREELDKVLEAHRKWVESKGKEGERAFPVAANLQGAVLTVANLQKATLSEANLQGADLWGANLQGALLDDAKLQGAVLFEANLQGAVLTVANLQGAVLFEANLQGAVLGGANLQRAKLNGANLQRAFLFDANLQRAVLGGAKGLIASQVKTADNWQLAFYSVDFLKELGLPPDHNERVKKKLAELEKKEKATGGK